MNRLFPILLSAIVIISTLLLCIFPPKQLKTVNIVDTSFNIKTSSVQEKQVVSTNINNVNTTAGISNTQVVNKTVTSQVQVPAVTNKNVVTSTKKVQASQQNVVKNVPAKPVAKTAVATQKTQVKLQQPAKAQTKTTVNQKQEAAPKTQPVTVQQPQKTVQVAKPATTAPATPVQQAPAPTKKVLTEQEETIAWNAWRSRVDNEFVRLYNATRVSIPAGTKLTYSFNVDKFKNITNITIKTDPVRYQATAQNAFIPMIARMNGKSFLTFPEGTRRTSVVVQRTKTIANSNYYTTEKDFSDYEKVKVTR